MIMIVDDEIFDLENYEIISLKCINFPSHEIEEEHN